MTFVVTKIVELYILDKFQAFLNQFGLKKAPHARKQAIFIAYIWLSNVLLIMNLCFVGLSKEFDKN